VPTENGVAERFQPRHLAPEQTKPGKIASRDSLSASAKRDEVLLRFS